MVNTGGSIKLVGKGDEGRGGHSMDRGMAWTGGTWMREAVNFCIEKFKMEHVSNPVDLNEG